MGQAQTVDSYLPVGGSGDTGMLKEGARGWGGSSGRISFTGAVVIIKGTAIIMACGGM